MCRMKGSDPTVIHLAGPFQAVLPADEERGRADALLVGSIRFSLSVEKFLMSTDFVLKP